MELPGSPSSMSVEKRIERSKGKPIPKGFQHPTGSMETTWEKSRNLGIPLWEEGKDSREQECSGILEWFGLEKPLNPIQSHLLEHQKSPLPRTPPFESQVFSILTSFCFPAMPAPLFQAAAPPPPGACKNGTKKFQEIPGNPNPQRARLCLDRGAALGCPHGSREGDTWLRSLFSIRARAWKSKFQPLRGHGVYSHWELLQGIWFGIRFPKNFQRIFQPSSCS